MATLVKDNILQHGEHTGNFHKATGKNVTVSMEDNNEMIVNAPEGAVITHQEHNPVELPSGIYTRKIVNEYDHFLEESRKVID